MITRSYCNGRLKSPPPGLNIRARDVQLCLGASFQRRVEVKRRRVDDGNAQIGDTQIAEQTEHEGGIQRGGENRVAATGGDGARGEFQWDREIRSDQRSSPVSGVRDFPFPRRRSWRRLERLVHRGRGVGLNLENLIAPPRFAGQMTRAAGSVPATREFRAGADCRASGCLRARGASARP